MSLIFSPEGPTLYLSVGNHRTFVVQRQRETRGESVSYVALTHVVKLDPVTRKARTVGRDGYIEAATLAQLDAEIARRAARMARSCGGTPQGGAS